MSIEEVLGGVSELLKPLRCGEDTLSVMPSLAFCIGMGLLFYKVLRQGRPPIFRRIPRDTLVQEVIFSWLINITVKGWMLFLDGLEVLLVQHYSRQMRVWFPPKWRSQGPDLGALPSVVQALLHPMSLKVVICSLVAVLPFLAIWKINKDGERVRNFMVWLGHNRWEQTELGFGRHFVNRPARVFDPPASPPRAPTLPTRRSTGSLDVDAADRTLRHGPRLRAPPTGVAALRASKSLH